MWNRQTTVLLDLFLHPISSCKDDNMSFFVIAFMGKSSDALSFINYFHISFENTYNVVAQEH